MSTGWIPDENWREASAIPSEGAYPRRSLGEGWRPGGESGSACPKHSQPSGAAG